MQSGKSEKIPAKNISTTRSPYQFSVSPEPCYLKLTMRNKRILWGMVVNAKARCQVSLKSPPLVMYALVAAKSVAKRPAP